MNRAVLSVVSRRLCADKASQHAAAAAGALRCLRNPQQDDQDENLEVAGKRKRYLLSKLRTCQNMCLIESMLTGRPLDPLRVRVALPGQLKSSKVRTQGKET